MPVSAAADEQTHSGAADGLNGHEVNSVAMAAATTDVDRPLADAWNSMADVDRAPETIDISAEGWKPKQRSQRDMNAVTEDTGRNFPSPTSSQEAVTVNAVRGTAQNGGKEHVKGGSDLRHTPPDGAVPAGHKQVAHEAAVSRDSVTAPTSSRQGSEDVSASKLPEQEAPGTKHARARSKQNSAPQAEAGSGGLFDAMSAVAQAAGFLATGSGLLNSSILGTMAAREGVGGAARGDDVFHTQVRRAEWG